MKIPTVLLAALVCAICSTDVKASDDQLCSVATLKGGYGFTFTGSAHTAAGQSPRAGVGRWVMDGRGTFWGTVTIVADGAVLRRPLIGTYVVEADCTGSAEVTFTDSADGHSTFDLVIDDDGNEIRVVVTPPAGAPVPLTQTSILRRQHTRD